MMAKHVIGFCVRFLNSYLYLYIVFTFFQTRKNSSSSDHLVIEVGYNVLVLFVSIDYISDRDRNEDSVKTPVDSLSITVFQAGQVGVSGRVFARNYYF